MKYIERRKHIIQSFKAKEDKRRNTFDKVADFMTNIFGTTSFLVINALFFFAWIILNINIFPIKPFDEFPFGFLTMVVSLEAIFLSIIVLISQNRAEKVADLREEIDLQVNIIAEEEITKIMEMLKILLEKNGVDLSNDEELKYMIKEISADKIEKELTQGMD